MKDKRKKQKILAVMDAVAAALAIVAGSMNFTATGDWKWICWVVIVILLYLRVWMALDALRREKDMSENWRVLCQKASNQGLDLAWEIEQMRVKHTKEDEG